MDRMACQIEIGGKVSRSAKNPEDPEQPLLEALIGHINDEGASHEYGDAPTAITSEADLLEYIAGVESTRGLLQFRHAEKAGGKFEDLEFWLQEAGIPYRRWTEAKFEYDAEEVIWLPEMSKSFHCILDQECNEVVKATEIREVMELLVEYRTEEPVRTDYLEEAITKLRKLCPDIPQVPKFELVD